MASVAQSVLSAFVIAMLGLLAPTAAQARPVSGAHAWCAPEVETLPGDVCYLDGGSKTRSRRTLVIFLHGAIAKNTNWSQNHERMLLKLAKAHGVDVLFPKSPLTEVGYVWPGTATAQQTIEQELIDGWMAAKTALEQRDHRPFDDVFVIGFSSGAYFASSLAMRGRLDVDGYAVFAGGQPMAAQATPVVRFSPVFVGVCADDETTAAHSRAFAASVAAAGIPRAVTERHVGHGLDHVHFANALTYLRAKKMNRQVTKTAKRDDLQF
jgi:predicted esterase